MWSTHVAVILPAMGVVVACGGRELLTGETASQADADTAGMEAGDDPPLGSATQVDLLFVVDNSSSMATEQRGLVQSAPGLVERLLDAGLDVRVGITTTDMGHRACPAFGSNDTTPEYGALRAVSCTERPEEFEWPHSSPTINAINSACYFNCAELLGGNWSIAPTAVDGSDDLVARPWLEMWADGTSNIVGDSWANALRCALPQGIDGCGFEEPLEAMHAAVLGSADPQHSNFGFLRDEALLAVVILTDEVDCSTNPDVGELVFSAYPSTVPSIFANGDKTTSADCWNAGTVCVGDGAPYETCEPQSYNLSGEAVPSDDDPSLDISFQPVLWPVGRYERLLQSRLRRPVVAVLSGVPVGYETGQDELVYRAAEPGSDQWLTWGIDNGCTLEQVSEVQTALPPVRLRSFAEHFHRAESGLARNLISVCDDNYEDEVNRIAELVGAAVYETTRR
ncbi:MAG: hypothetical protein L7S64_12870 [Longimicrobiales bacterium]|nr:hypothetical protein [Longimicrobiales bacterium]